MRATTVLILFLLTFALASLGHASIELPSEFRSGLVWLKVSVPGEKAPLNFLLDSGAGSSVIDLAAAKRAGVALGAPRSVLGVGARTTGYEVSGFGGEVAGLRVADRLLALDLSPVSKAIGSRIDGLVGADFLRNRVVRIDFSRRSVCVLERAAIQAGAQVIPMVPRGDALCVKVAVAGNAADWMRVDTGCDSALRWVVPAAAARKLSASSSIAVTAGLPRTMTTEIKLGSLTLGEVKTGVHTREIFPGEAGLLGNGLLSRFTVTLDAAHRQLILVR